MEKEIFHDINSRPNRLFKDIRENIQVSPPFTTHDIYGACCICKRTVLYTTRLAGKLRQLLLLYSVQTELLIMNLVHSFKTQEFSS